VGICGCAPQHRLTQGEDQPQRGVNTKGGIGPQQDGRLGMPSTTSAQASLKEGSWQHGKSCPAGHAEGAGERTPEEGPLQ